MHQSVLIKEVLNYLDPQPNENFIDCTFGEGGHTIALLEKTGPHGKVLGIEVDPILYEKARLKLSDVSCSNPSTSSGLVLNEVERTKFQVSRLILVNDSFVNLGRITAEHNFQSVKGILFDLGLSSWHLEESGRGLSFLRDEVLDMRFSPGSQKQTAENILNSFSEKEIKKILEDFGEERYAARIAKKIIDARKVCPIETTRQLTEIIREATPASYSRGRIHFATRTFQALRIAVNDELENLKKTLPQAVEILSRGGRLVVISFHSLEDRIVKNFLKENAKKEILRIATKKLVVPEKDEIEAIPRSRSAQLRAAIKD